MFFGNFGRNPIVKEKIDKMNLNTEMNHWAQSKYPNSGPFLIIWVEFAYKDKKFLLIIFQFFIGKNFNCLAHKSKINKLFEITHTKS